jgi:AraC-like DNA-binding protein
MSFSLSGELRKKLRNSSLTLSVPQKEMLYGIISLLRENLVVEDSDYIEFIHILEGDQMVCQQVASLCENFFLSLCRDNTPIVDHPRSFETEMFRNAVLLMDEYIYDWISAEFIAKKLNVSVSYLKKIFSKYAGLGIHKYFLKSKITIACRLLRRGMSVCEVSEKLSFSSHNYFSTVFKRETGKTVSEYIREKRMEHAAHLLVSTTLQIQTVALHCGILDVQYFSKLFKRHTGKTPKEYRETLENV